MTNLQYDWYIIIMINNYMLQEENNENGVINQEASQMNSQRQMDNHQMTPELQENRMHFPQIKSKRRQANDQKKELFNIFYELVTLVNEHAQALEPTSPSSILNTTHTMLQLNGANRLVSKKKNKSNKITTLQNQKTIEGEKSKAHFSKKQSFSNHKQMSSQNLKKSALQESLSEKISKEVCKRRAIYVNYSTVMNYFVHESEDEAEASPNPNFQVQKVKNHEHSMSQYSFALSSRNLQSKERRKLSLQKSVQVKVPRSLRQMQISPQFQITQKNEEMCIVNYPNGFHVRSPDQN